MILNRLVRSCTYCIFFLTYILRSPCVLLLFESKDYGGIRTRFAYFGGKKSERYVTITYYSTGETVLSSMKQKQICF